MNKIKDLFYDINDILIAVMILIAAALIIFTRIDIIVTYPEKIALAQSQQSGQIHTQPSGPTVNPPPAYEPPDADEEPSDEPGDEPDEEPVEEPGAEEAPPQGPEAPSAYSLYIAYGESMNSVAKNLVTLGFFESAQDFLNTLEKNNLSTRVQAGTFILPAGSSKDDIVKIITKTN